MGKKTHIVIVSGAILLLVFLISTSKNKEKEKDLILNGKNQMVNSGFYGEKKQIEDFFSLKENFEKDRQVVQIGITSHHLPDAFPIISDFWKKIYVSNGPRNTFIILGPDHFEKCNSLFSVSGLDYKTPFGNLTVDEEIRDVLERQGVDVNDFCFEGEHSMGVQTLFIKHLYPEAKIVPILFSSKASENVVDDIVDLIAQYKDRATIILSVDFSHFNSFQEAQKIDSRTLEMIKEQEEKNYKLKMVDSPGALETTIMIAKRWEKAEFVTLKLGNSFEFSKNQDSTTGYISGYFK